MSEERPPCKCHGSWPLHADDQAAALRKLGLDNDRLESQNQALQEENERLYGALARGVERERALRAEASRLRTDCPPQTDPTQEPFEIEWTARPEDFRDPLDPSRNMAGGVFLVPTQETDPE